MRGVDVNTTSCDYVMANDFTECHLHPKSGSFKLRYVIILLFPYINIQVIFR